MSNRSYLLSFLIAASLLASSLKANALDKQEIKTFPTILKGNVQEQVKQEIPKTGIGVIGLRFIHQSGFPSFIEQVYSNSPASRAGIRSKDLIFAIDGVRTDKLNSDGVYQLLAGPPGSTVRVFVTRGQSMFNVEMLREDLANFPAEIQNRYLAGPIIMPVGNDYSPYH
jgi:C-terminal processing protease CtpA/Prc